MEAIEVDTEWEVYITKEFVYVVTLGWDHSMDEWLNEISDNWVLEVVSPPWIPREDE